ncbi:hypothetical protein [Streptosporangium roseum]|uniref:hypothetical protein n=1 Tax=Streptosporangium roseum TaxID=2001 RepID=UPI0012DE88E0|nr:hypothetical protein [Streptosporangium roseum]
MAATRPTGRIHHGEPTAAATRVATATTRASQKVGGWVWPRAWWATSWASAPASRTWFGCCSSSAPTSMRATPVQGLA